MREIKRRRTAVSKMFDLGDGYHKVTMRRTPYHFRKDNNYEDIDFTPRICRQHGDHIVDQAPYCLRVKPDRPCYRYTSQAGEVVVDLIKIGGQSVKPRPPVKTESMYVWFDISTDIDYYIEPRVFGVRTHLYLNSPEALRKFEWRFTVTLTC